MKKSRRFFFAQKPKISFSRKPRRHYITKILREFSHSGEILLTFQAGCVGEAKYTHTLEFGDVIAAHETETGRRKHHRRKKRIRIKILNAGMNFHDETLKTR